MILQRLYIVILLCGSFVFAKAQSSKNKDDFNILKKRLLQDSTFDPSTTVPDTEGKWKDIDYEDSATNDWQPIRHWHRTAWLARIYRYNLNDRFTDKELEAGISNALNFWYKKHPVCRNWWWNSIGVPLLMGEVLLLMDDALSEAQRQQGYKLMEVGIKPDYYVASGEPATGQNSVWLATVHLMMGISQRDSKILVRASNVIKTEVKISKAEGIQADYSFHQHGPQLYSGGYGKGFAQDVTRFISLFHGTHYAFSKEKIAIFSSYILDGLQWATYKSTLDYSTLGREISRNQEAGRASTLIKICRELASMNLPRKKELEAMASRLEAASTKELIGNKHFWRSDFMTHHAKGFYTSIKFASSRVRAIESGNQENLKAWYLGRGVQFIFRTGLEYREIFPLLDWKRLPGTLAEQGNDSPPLFTWGIGAEGKKVFAGGVSDGRYGAAAYDYDYLNVRAKRFWACFDKEVICLGAGIYSSSDNSVFQSINQCLQNGHVTIGSKTEKYSAFMEGQKTSTDISWVHHDSIAYFFPIPKNITVKGEKQSGSWKQINNQASYSDNIITKPVFSVWIDLGKKVANESYSYIIVPNISAKYAGDYVNPIKILRNDTAVQGVQHTLLGLTAASFYQPDTLEAGNGLKLSVNSPVMLMFRQTADSVHLSVSSPENKTFVVEVTVNQRLVCDKCKWLPQKGVTRVTVELPGGSNAGKSVTKNMQRKIAE